MTDLQTASTTASCARRSAWAKYEVIRPGVAFITIDYLGAADLWSAFRVEIRSPGVGANGVDPLYEASYAAAGAAARVHGYELERFAPVDPPARPREASLVDERPWPISWYAAALTPIVRPVVTMMLEQIGWEIRDIDRDHGRAVMRLFRADGRWLHVAMPKDGRATIERWQRDDTMERGKGRRGDRGPTVYAFEDRFLGRTRCDGVQSLLRAMCDYLADNPAPGRPALSAGAVGRAVGLLMSGEAVLAAKEVE